MNDVDQVNKPLHSSSLDKTGWSQPMMALTRLYV